MKKVSDGYWTYRGFDIYEAAHPKLEGKYEIYTGEYFMIRSYTLKEAAELIDRRIANSI